MFNMGISGNQLYEEGNWQDIREQQEQLLTVENIPNIGMAVSIDTNEDPNNADDMIRIHPKNKLPVGERLAQVALKRTYNMDIVGESPHISRYKISNDTVFLVFKNVGNGLKIKTGDTELKGFAMASADKIFKSANAGIMNDSIIIVKCNTITTPVSVRYGWSKNPICNLYNSSDLPASPFRTDVWKSGYAYSAFASTCPASSDATLIGIQTNGAKLMDFSTEKLHYELKSIDIRQVTAYANSPFATVTIEQATIQNGRKATISVQAEDKTLRVYEVHFDNNTNTRSINKDNFKITQQDKKLIIDVNSDMNGTFKIFNSFGQSIHNKHFNGSFCHQFSVNNAGVYLARLNTVGSDYSLKFIIK
jgi:hypothetical protein